MDLSKFHDDSLGIMERTAVGSSGRVGSLYDGYRDCVLKELKVKIKQFPSEGKSVSCELINGNTGKSQNLLKMIGIEADLRLNILLYSEPRTGIAALIDYPDPVNGYTRFLYYTYVHQIEQLDTIAEPTNLPESLNLKNIATHIITDVSWGINVVVVLQLLPESNEVTTVDEVLKKVRAFLGGDENYARFSLKDEQLFEKNVNTKVYSNIPGLRKMTSVFTICQYINGRGEQFNLYRPLKYLLKPIKCLYPQYTGFGVNFSPLSSQTIDNLEEHLMQLLDTVKKQKDSLDYTINDLLRKYLNEQVCEVQQEWANLKVTHKTQIKQLEKLITDIRLKCIDISEIDKALEYHTQMTLQNCIETLTRSVNKLEAKRLLITNFDQQHFEYCNVAKLNVNQEDYEQILLHNLATDQRENRILCSNDTLNEKNQSKLNSLQRQLTEEHGMNQDLRLVYADFEYCTFELSDMMILPLNQNIHNVATEEYSISASTKVDIINILLLGESGVGKSTFINAFVNYLIFETLEKAESNKPVVLIPVSFMMTTGDNFEESIINFGGFDNFNNEDFDHPGQSVTQHCKSYVFALNHSNGRKLRIIDTPGFGDTRGLDQDDTNMQHILKYINSLTHLNAICFLLKPNASQLNIFFRTCLTQLLNLVGSNARQNIIFCFTNARSTFYTPGNTASLLRAMLDSLSINDIPFKKENTFCFDNESFRYLVALKNGIDFNNDEQKHEYEMSWSTSFRESNRLVSYINNQIKSYSLSGNRQSINHAQIEIIQMIRPMLEAMRNILRHIVLDNMKMLNKSIKLRPVAIHRPASRCNVCEPDPVKIGKFLIANHDPHEIRNHCYHCSCISSQHSSIDYVLHYELLGRSVSYNRKTMDDMIQELCQASNNFGYFLINIVRSTIHDPFLIGLTSMICEENDLCQIQQSNNLNSKLVENLKKLHDRYEQSRNEMNSHKKHIELSVIYDWIQKIHILPEVREQMDAVKRSQQILMKECEYVVSEDVME